MWWEMVDWRGCCCLVAGSATSGGGAGARDLVQGSPVGISDTHLSLQMQVRSVGLVNLVVTGLVEGGWQERVLLSHLWGYCALYVLFKTIHFSLEYF